METALSKKIKEFLSLEKISITQLEQRAGVKTGIIANILQGRSKNPRLENLQAIANTLGCLVEDLIDKKSGSQVATKKPLINIIRGELYRDCLDKILLYLENNPVNITNKKFLYILENVYNYSLQEDESSNEADTKFIKWFIEKSER